jgi:hypothetical protein
MYYSRPAGTQILAANNVIQELLKTNDVLRMENEWLKQQLAASKKEYVDREDEVKRLRFLVYLNRSRSDGLRTTLKLALEQIDSLPLPPPVSVPAAQQSLEEEGAEEKENKENTTSNVSPMKSRPVEVSANKPSVVLPPPAGKSPLKDSKELNQQKQTKVPSVQVLPLSSNSSSSSANKMEKDTGASTHHVSSSVEPLHSSSSPSPSKTSPPLPPPYVDPNIVKVVENGRVISVQSDLAAKLEQRRQSVEPSPQTNDAMKPPVKPQQATQPQVGPPSVPPQVKTHKPPELPPPPSRPLQAKQQQQQQHMPVKIPDRRSVAAEEHPFEFDEPSVDEYTMHGKTNKDMWSNL